MDELRAIVESQRPSVICIVETWLSNEIRDQEISLPEYQVIRLDRVVFRHSFDKFTLRTIIEQLSAQLLEPVPKYYQYRK